MRLSLFAELVDEIRTISEPAEIQALWSGKNAGRISSPVEEVSHVFDDYQIDSFIALGASALGLSSEQFQNLRDFRDQMAAWNAHIGSDLARADWRDLFAGDEWVAVMEKAKRFIDSLQRRSV